uniref:Uncharacterized protein n=1 Tax=viral metagenome TaxID=1070528 RepID=A0A6H1Z8J4_9ZZZZ
MYDEELIEESAVELGEEFSEKSEEEPEEEDFLLDETNLWKPQHTIGTVGKSDRHDAMRLVAWMPVQECKAKKCNLFSDCNFPKEGKCALETTYLLNVFSLLISKREGLGKDLSAWEMDWVGNIIMPLYHQLIRMKKVAFNAPIVTMGKFREEIHPIHREVRDVIREIGREMKEKRIFERVRRKYGTIGLLEGGNDLIGRLLEEGDPDYYASIER